MWSNNIGIVFSNHPYAEVFQDSLADNKYGTHVFYLGMTSFFFTWNVSEITKCFPFPKAVEKARKLYQKKKTIKKTCIDFRSDNADLTHK